MSRRQQKQLYFETMEQRIVLATGTASIIDGALRICGTAGNDTIVIAELSDNFWVSASFLQTPQLFAKTDATSIKVTGGDGDDTIVATSLQTTATLEGNAGDDRVFGSFVADNIFGGPGADLIFGNGGDDNIFAGTGEDRVFAGGGNDTIYGGDDNDLIQGNDGDDTVRGEGGNDQLFGSGGADSVYGGFGDDTLLGGAGNDMLFGGSGNDTLVGEGDNDQLFGEADDDSLLGGGGQDQLNGGMGNDQLVGGNGDDSLDGGDGNDTMFGDAGADEMSGGAATDSLFGGVGPDILLGNAGTDTLRGGNGNDILAGHSGYDLLFGGEDKDVLISGGHDSSAAVLGQLNGEGNEDLLIAGSTNHQGDFDALRETQAAWGSSRDHDLRLADALATFSITDFETQYSMNGGNGRDAFFADSTSQSAGAQANEILVGFQLLAANDEFTVAIGDTITTTSNQSLLVNDQMVDVGATVSIVEQAAHGTVTLNADGTFSYTQSTYGRDSFVYEVTEPGGETTRATVKLTVDGLPELPADATITTLASGLQFHDFVVGDGQSPVFNSTVNINYVGYLPNGNIFDSNEFISFNLQQVIAGFSVGVDGMNVGGTRRIIIPPDLGYGPNGNPGAGIGGEDTIIFDVDLHTFVTP